LFRGVPDLKDDAGAKLGSDAGGFDRTLGSAVVSQQVTKWHLSVSTSSFKAFNSANLHFRLTRGL
jgi:hypothetical protein